MPNIVFGGKIRSFRPESLPLTTQDEAATVEVAQPVAPGPGRKTRQPKEVPVMREEVFDLRYEQFPHLPPDLWNHMTSAFRESMKAFSRAFSEAYRAGIDDNLLPLLDKTIRDLVQKLGRDLMEGLLLKERGFIGTRVRCHVCSREAEYSGDVHKSLMTLLGSVPTNRSYYVCPEGHEGHTFYPQDILLGVDGEHRMLPSVQVSLSRLTKDVPFKRAVGILEELLGLDLSEETAKRVTATVASLVQAQQEIERQQAFTPTEPVHPTPMDVSPDEVGVLGADGGFLAIRGKEERSEFKVGVLGTMIPTPGQVPKRLESGHRVARELARTTDKLYLAHLEGIDQFSEHLTVEFFRRGLHKCSTLHFVADGAGHFWTRFEALVQPHQEVSRCLDLPHAMEHVNLAARTIFDLEKRESASRDVATDPPDESNVGESRPPPAEKKRKKYQALPKPEDGTDKRRWYDSMEDCLLEGRLDDFFDELTRQRAALKGHKDRVKVVDDTIRYFEERRHLLRYKECLERGLPIGSGMIEGGVRFIGKDRLDRSGMKWNVEGAEAILQLRCLDASNRWDAFFRDAAAKRLALYHDKKAAWLSQP